MYNYRGRRRRSPRTVKPDSEYAGSEILDQDDFHEMDRSHSTEMSKKYEDEQNMYNNRGRRRRSPTTVLRYADYRRFPRAETPDSGYAGSETLYQDDFHEMDRSHSTEMSKYEDEQNMYNNRGRRRRSPTTVLRYADYFYRRFPRAETPDSGYAGSETLYQDDFHEMDRSHSTEMSKYEDEQNMYNTRGRRRRSPTTVLRYADYFYRRFRRAETPDSGYAGSETLDQDDFYEIDGMPDIIEEETTDFQENIIIRKLVKSQIYFIFPPSPLNAFDYGMTKLSKIEEILLDEFPIKSSQPLVKECMSFTFVHGSHLDTNQASLALFNAEPDERQNDDNNSGIVVVYLDEKFTFEVLQYLADKNDISGIKGNVTFIAVNSDKLLQDKSNLRCTLRSFFGKRLHVVDAKEQMDKLYKEFENILSQAIEDKQKMIDDVRRENGEDERLREVEKRFSELCKLHKEDMSDSCETKEKLMWSESTLSRLKGQGLQGYTLQQNTLVLFFQYTSTGQSITEDIIPTAIRKRFPKLKIVQFQKPLFIPHHIVKSGDKLHPFQHEANRYGTVGMFGVLSQLDRQSIRCCISSPHVISSGQSAYILNSTVRLGKCIWPPVVGANRINVEDISVICSESLNINIKRMVWGQIALFHGDRSELKKRKVYKYGATTSKTIGFIQDSEFVLTIGDPVRVFIIEPEDPDDDSSRFSQPGDSGAIVFTKFGQHVVALSMIFGGDVDLEGIAKNGSIAVDLNEAIKRFEAKNVGKSLHLDTL